jgi:hypothetical protein
MIAETMAGIALVKASVDGIKSAIGTAQDIGDIAKFIDGMFDGEQQIQKDRSKASKDPFSIKSVAEETINAKLAQEHMTEMKNLIDTRFGHGTWAGIIAERSRRIQEQKELEKQQRILRQKKKAETIHNLQIWGLIFVCVIVLVSALLVILSLI